MSPDQQVFYLTLHSTGLFLILAASIPALGSIASKLVWRPKTDVSTINYQSMRSRRRCLYYDEDGEATIESQKAFSGTWSTFSLVLLSVAGSVISVGLLCAGIKTLFGGVVEFGAPVELMRIENGSFRNLVESSANTEREELERAIRVSVR